MAARLHVWRKPPGFWKLYMGAAVAYTLLLDGHKAAELRSGSVADLEVSAGLHELALHWKKLLTYDSEPLRFEAVDGEELYFEAVKGNARAPGPDFFYINRVDGPGVGWPAGG